MAYSSPAEGGLGSPMFPPASRNSLTSRRKVGSRHSLPRTGARRGSNHSRPGGRCAPERKPCKSWIRHDCDTTLAYCSKILILSARLIASPIAIEGVSGSCCGGNSSGLLVEHTTESALSRIRASSCRRTRSGPRRRSLRGAEQGGWCARNGLDCILDVILGLKYLAVLNTRIQALHSLDRGK